MQCWTFQYSRSPFAGIHFSGLIELIQYAVTEVIFGVVNGFGILLGTPLHEMCDGSLVFPCRLNGVTFFVAAIYC